MKPIYKRVLLKISGEALAGEQRFGINEEMTRKVAKEVKEIHDLGVQVAIVVGGGNFWSRQNQQGYGPRDGRLYGDAGNRDEFAGASGRISGTGR